MGLLTKFRLGNGKLDPKLRAELEAEGLVLTEEGCFGWIHYERFKAPGKRFHGKRSGERMAIGISERRFVVYCRSGTLKLVDGPFTDPRLAFYEVTADKPGQLAIRIDYDRIDIADVSGKITITVNTERAAEVAEQVEARVERP